MAGLEIVLFGSPLPILRLQYMGSLLVLKYILNLKL